MGGADSAARRGGPPPTRYAGDLVVPTIVVSVGSLLSLLAAVFAWTVGVGLLGTLLAAACTYLLFVYFTKFWLLKMPQPKCKLLHLDPAKSYATPEASLKSPEDDLDEKGNSTRWCVIGAGWSGLAVSGMLQRKGEKFTIFERESSLGGNWTKGVYEGVHMISSKSTTEMTDYPFPKEYPTFPSAAQVLQYLNDYADHFQLRQHIQFSSNVVRAVPLIDGSQWLVTLESGEKRRYKGVIVCNGHDWEPNMPVYPGHPTLEIMHSHDYKGPHQLRGKRVLTVGGGNSACDVAVEASRSALFSGISLRRGYWILPRLLYGRPIAEVFCHWAPTYLQHLWFALGLYIVFGKYTDYGLEQPSHTLFDHPVTVSETIMQELKKGSVKAFKEIQSIEGKMVTFKDGKQMEFDLLVLATGYKEALPMLEGYIEFKNGIPQFLHGMIHPHYKNQFLLGYGQARYGCGPLISAGADAIGAFMEAQKKMTYPIGIVLRTTGSKPKRAGKNTNDVIIDPYKAFGQRWLVKNVVAPLLPVWERLLFPVKKYDPLKIGSLTEDAL